MSYYGAMAYVTIQTMPIMMNECDVYGDRFSQIEYSLLSMYALEGFQAASPEWLSQPLGDDIQVRCPMVLNGRSGPSGRARRCS